MMLRTEFTQYEDDTFYFLYVTDTLRIETDGMNGLQVEDRSGRVTSTTDDPQVMEAILVLEQCLESGTSNYVIDSIRDHKFITKKH